MPQIENVSWDDVKHGWHYDCGEDAVLIQIADPATFFPEPKNKFHSVHQFEFLDAEDNDERYPDETKIQDDQAKALVDILLAALAENRNVLVHCHAGICRSGAVTEVAFMLGFEPTGRYRQPNLRVKHKMMKCLGWTYDSDEPTYSVGGTTTDGGIIPSDYSDAQLGEVNENLYFSGNDCCSFGMFRFPSSHDVSVITSGIG